MIQDLEHQIKERNMYNKIILQGNLVRDIEIRYTNSGKAIGKTSIAVNKKFKSATGEQKEEVLFVDLEFFGRVAEILNQYCTKGSKILIDGELKLSQWTAQDGTKRSRHSVTVQTLQMLDSKDSVPNSRTDTDRYQEAPSPVGAPTVPNTKIPLEITETEIPF